MVDADPKRIEQVLTHLLANALRFSPPETPVAAWIALVNDQARVSIRDQGPGIPPESQARVFDRYYRAPGIHPRNGSQLSLGVGLYLCRQIILRHDGAIGLESAVGQGTTVWFTLPTTTASVATGQG
jgi:signal transduction histidine kinase